MRVSRPFRIVMFLLLAASGAVCQQRDRSSAAKSLPDAPSVTASQFDSSRWQASAPGPVISYRDAQVLFGDSYRLEPLPERESGDFFQKHLYPTLLKRGLEYRPSSSSGFLSRATYATSRLFFEPEDSGKKRLNTSYLLGTLASAAMHSAYRPYWRRSISQPFSDFGASIGNDAGMNILHEFGPGIRQLMKSHEPKFVSAIEEHITHHN